MQITEMPAKQEIHDRFTRINYQAILERPGSPILIVRHEQAEQLNNSIAHFKKLGYEVHKRSEEEIIFDQANQRVNISGREYNV